jgi:hypothetical protein
VSQELKLTPKGLYSQPSLIGEDIPDGAMVTADNVVIKREGIVEPRRGVMGYATLTANRLASYQDKLIAHSSTGTVSYDNGSGTITALSGTFAPPDANTAKTRFAQAGQNLFLTTSAGVYRMDAYNSVPLLSGAIKATGFDRDGRVYSSTAGNMSLTSNVITVTTTAAHGFYVGQVVSQTSADEAPYIAGSYTVLTVPSSTSFTYAHVAGNDAANANTHTFAPTVLVTSGGFLADGSHVAYRVVFNCPDANNTEKPGAASPRIIVDNASGVTGWVGTEAKNVVVRAFVPSGVTTSFSIRLYRSGQVDTSIEPSDDLQLVYEALVKSNEIAQGWVDITDVTPDALRGAFGYFAPSQEGIARNNERPPIAKDIAEFGGSMHYANTTSPHRMTINILAVGGTGGIQDGDALLIAGDGFSLTYTAKTTPTSAAHFKLETGGTVSANIRNTALNLCAAINRFSDISAFYVSGQDEAPGRILLEARDLGEASFGTQLSGTTHPVNRGAWSPFMSVVGRAFTLSRTGTTVTATDFLAATLDFVVGDSVTQKFGEPNFPAGVKVITSVSGTTFTYTEAGAATVGGTAYEFNVTNYISSTAQATPNRIYHSKTNLHEAVPLLSFNDLGSKGADLLRIIALRDSMFAFKEDGLFRGTGGNGSFQWALFDPTIVLVAPDSAVTLGNMIYALTTQGVVAISDTGSEIVSRPIEKTLVELMATDLAKVQQVTFGVGYETERTYELRTISAASETTATQAFIYNTVTGTWTRDTITTKCGVIHPADNKRYLGGATQVLKERKAYTYADYSDVDLSVTIAGGNEDGFATVPLSSTTGVAAGDILSNNSQYARITAVNGLNVSIAAEDRAAAALMTFAAATVYKAIATAIQWAPATGKNPGTSKLWQETNLLMGNAHFASATESHATELIPTFEATSIDGTAAVGQWTTAAATWGGTEKPFNLRLIVPQEMRRSSRLSLKWAVSNAWAAWNISGISILYEPGSNRTSR